MMMAALSVNAQGEEILTTQQSDIKGSWHAIVDDIYTCFTFANNGLVNVLMTVDINDENFSAQMKVTIPGTYSVTGSKLNIVTDKERCDIQLDNFKMKGDAEGMEDIAKKVFNFAITNQIYPNEDNYRYERRSAEMEVLINKDVACVFGLPVNAVNMTTGEVEGGFADFYWYKKATGEIKYILVRSDKRNAGQKIDSKGRCVYAFSKMIVGEKNVTVS